MKVIVCILFAFGLTTKVFADSITHGSTTINMEFVDVGNAGNTADTTGYGAVGYSYRMGKFEVTTDQFAKARVADSRVGNGNEGYWNDSPRTVGSGGPASYVSAYEAMKFANYLTTGSAINGAYQFSLDGKTLLVVDRNAAVSTYGTVYVLPSENEWYKAAYYKPVTDGSYSLYANGSDSEGSLTHGTTDGWNYYNENYVNGPHNYTWETGYGGREQNGTYDMMGNLWEWSESAKDGTLENVTESRVIRGGAFSDNFENGLRSSIRSNASPASESMNFGFRVAAIPEPSSLAMIGLACGLGLFVRRSFRR